MSLMSIMSSVMKYVILSTTILTLGNATVVIGTIHKNFQFKISFNMTNVDVDSTAAYINKNSAYICFTFKSVDMKC